MSNETMWNPSDAAKKDAPAASSGGGKEYAIPFKALLKGSIAIKATSKKGALAQARKLFKTATLQVKGEGDLAITVKKGSIKPTKK